MLQGGYPRTLAFRATLVSILLLASGCYVTTAGGRPYDAGPEDAGRPRRDTGPADRDSGPPTDAGPPPDTGPATTDAGPLRPTAIVEVATSTTSGGHSAVVWDGREFVLAYLVGDGSGTRVADVHVAWYPPGSVTPRGAMALTSSPLERDSVSLSASGGRIAVGWTERSTGVMSVWTFTGTVLGDAGAMVPIYANVLDGPDHDDAFVYWDGRTPVAAVRTPEGMTEALYGLEGMGAVRFHGEMAIGELAPVANRTILVTGTSAMIFGRTAAGWIELGRASGLVAPTEGDAAVLADGSLAMVFVDRPTMADRSLHYLRFASAGDAWLQTGVPIAIGESGPDPAVDAAGDRLILAWARATMVDRPAAVAAVGPDGRIVGSWCRMPERFAVANDPDIACSAAWCFVTWVEADTYEATDFVTRIVQLPVEPDLVCP